MKTIGNIKKLITFTSGTRKYIIIYMFLTLLASILMTIIPVITSFQLVNLTEGVWDKVIIFSVAILIISIIRHLISLIISFCTEKFSKLIIRRIQVNIAEEILKIKVENIDKKSNGLFIQRLTNDASSIAEIFTFGISSINNIVVELCIFIMVYFINIWIGLYFTLFIILLFLIAKFEIKTVDKLDEKYRDQREKTSGFATELIRGIRDIKMLNCEVNFMKMINVNVSDLNRTNYKLNITRSLFWFVIESIYSIYAFLLVVIIVLFIKSGTLSLALGIVVYNYRGYVSNLIFRMNSFIDYLRGFNMSFDRVMEIFEHKDFSKEKFGKRHLDKVEGNFAFHDVEFSYGSNKVLKKISFEVKANETVGFVGKSGVGKSTIFNLLCKLYDIDNGSITIDGIDIKSLDKDSIRGNITIISQNPYIFNMSIRDNLKLVKEDMTDEEMIDACKRACLDDYIESLEDKYDTIVGEGGIVLSGGQRQRLAIARALVQKTEIILFDEATSALDNETQAKIQKSIENMKEEYTILIIAHRLSTIVNCDRILFIDDGKVVAEGTHEELLKNNKEYRMLYESELIEK